MKRGYDLPAASREHGNIPIISSSGPTGFHSKSKVKAPGVVTGRYGTIGQVFFVNQDFWPLNTTLYVRDFMGNDPKFISYFLRGINFLAYSDKAAVPGVNRNDLHEAAVEVPDVAEQERIACVLSALDDKIELNRRMNETLEAMARAVFRDWFVDFGPTRRKAAGETDPAAILGGLLRDPEKAPPSPPSSRTASERTACRRGGKSAPSSGFWTSSEAEHRKPRFPSIGGARCRGSAATTREVIEAAPDALGAVKAVLGQILGDDYSPEEKDDFATRLYERFQQDQSFEWHLADSKTAKVKTGQRRLAAAFGFSESLRDQVVDQLVEFYKATASGDAER